MFPETVPAPNYSAPLLNFKAQSPGQQQPQQPQGPNQSFLPKLPNGQIDFRKIASDLQGMGKTIGQGVGGVANGIGQGIGQIAQGVGQGANAAVTGSIGNGVGALLGL